ncbi:4-hydroxy-tetrahydrodipicolinate reductase [Pseudoroseomonas ludipueritiae]|uniref:4-hydroxy-tetrahydrodipicolinate reductase n=1 Tax=Pseudoroseomonas ludipueritiae TaxID=198093 RepID=A0ABR7RA97_9PROT|nr:4-hydroxy-tetrahydrodipicolinate reductase [Pseudoroseomonas ludipueritiae]MBC9178497.1 4-hydroxy-tetrahydrodipicolinate reductase [Pseudoroseomonas ludipueritiae]MCG7361861.1 4-hydroxy-tetrahydrodipicolinate reductase [Roseomonas sp. ACRSG]
MSTLRIGIAGISGRMGRLLAEEVLAAGAQLAGGTARSGGMEGVTLFSDSGALFAASDVVIDFTHASLAATHAALAATHRKPFVLGSSGLSAEQEAAVAQAARVTPIVYAANFAPGVNLLFALAERMAAALPGDEYDAEIVEMHHRQKVDSPSGTAIGLGRAVARGRGTTLEECGMESGRDGHTGPRQTGAIGFAALRGGQVVGEHTLLFAAGNEQIALTHRSFDRRVYAVGAVRAARWVSGRAPGLYDMKHVLGMG